MAFFDVKMTQVGSVETELKAECGEIGKKIPYALQEVGERMRGSLMEHIARDWYQKWKPSKYERRTDNPEYGTPIGDPSNMDLQITQNTLVFDYQPSRQHALHEPFSNSPDELIRTIQSGSVAPNAPPRPFWDNFVREQENETIMFTFKRAMLPYKVTDNGTKIDLSESYLNSEVAPTNQGMTNPADYLIDDL